MSRLRLAILGLAGWLAMAATGYGQPRPYIGFAYPAGGQRGTTVQIRLGGQNLDDIDAVLVTGKGVQAKLVDYCPRMNNQEMALLREQLNAIKPRTPKPQRGKAPSPEPKVDAATQQLIDRIEKRTREYVNTPAVASIANLAFVEVTIAPDAEPGRREIRLSTLRGVTNPMVFVVGQVPEVARKPMLTATVQTLGKEELALRKRPPEEVEDRITVPCTTNGQIASGEVNRYRFEARKGQRLVLATEARALIPYLADAVPGWFQPVLAIYDADGKEVAYDDDFRFKPDPVIFFEVPKDGEYVFAIHDAIYRGREDFVYRVTIGEMPFVTSVFPLGGRVGKPAAIAMKGWNLADATLVQPAKDAGPGVQFLTARTGSLVSNRVPYMLDALPEYTEQEPNNDQAHAQKVTLPTIVNGRIGRPDDWDVFQLTGRAEQTIVAEVYARRLDSPLDSLLKLTDANGKVLAFNDDHEDAGSGLNTHHADSYLSVKLPADGTYYLYLGDTARHGGEEYGYRLRISQPQPDFELRTVPSSVAMRGKSTASLLVYVLRRDGFDGDIKLTLKDPPEGFSALPAVIRGTQESGRLSVKTTLARTPAPAYLVVEGSAKIGDREVAHVAVPAEDRMQAFLWRHLVPAEDLPVMVYDPAYQRSTKRELPTVTAEMKSKPKPEPVPATGSAKKAKFTKQQVAGRLRELKRLYENWLINDEFYCRKVAECEAAE